MMLYCRPVITLRVMNRRQLPGRQPNVADMLCLAMLFHRLAQALFDGVTIPANHLCGPRGTGCAIRIVSSYDQPRPRRHAVIPAFRLVSTLCLLLLAISYHLLAPCWI